MMKKCKNTMLLAAMVTAASLSGLSQAQKILTPQTPIKTVKPVTTKAVPQRQEYRIPGKQFYNEAKNYGFNTNAHEGSYGSKCEVDTFEDPKGPALEVGRFHGFPGSKCDFNVFQGASLKNGFVFKSYSGRKEVNGRANIEMRSYPARGDTSMKFTFHGWDEAGDNEAYYYFTEFVLEGPANRDWRDALR